jgi:hypothetical protein
MLDLFWIPLPAVICPIYPLSEFADPVHHVPSPFLEAQGVEKPFSILFMENTAS